MQASCLGCNGPRGDLTPGPSPQVERGEFVDQEIGLWGRTEWGAEVV